MIDLSAFADSLKSEYCEILKKSPMSRQTSFKVGGNADIIAFPKNTDALIDVISKATNENIPFYVMGNGSNLLVKDCGIEGLVIKTTAMDPDIITDGNTIKCSAGTPLSKLCITAYENSLSGLEFAYGIPGTVGGAVFMNAGAYGGEMKDVLISVTHTDTNGNIVTMQADELDLGYRKSFYSDNTDKIILSAEFRLTVGDKTEIKAKMDDLMGRRKDKQPLEFPSAGSTFKRPEGHFAGALIEQCNLKGYTIGGAQVSEKHAGFIINRFNGTATDVFDLIDYVRNTVQNETGITLEPEVRIIP